MNRYIVLFQNSTVLKYYFKTGANTYLKYYFLLFYFRFNRKKSKKKKENVKQEHNKAPREN